MSDSTKKTGLTVAIMIVIAAAVFFGYYQMTSKVAENEEVTPTTEAGKLLKKDMEHDYPGTPREVLKLHGRITQCMYNDELTTQQLEGLLEQARKLYDDELLEENTWDEQLDKLLADREDYEKNERRVMSYTAQKSSQVKTYKKDGQQYAVTYLQFITTDKHTAYAESCEKFLLRKASDGKWKIIGWELADPDSVEIGED